MLTGQNAIITGSTSGIGLGIAEALAAKGANIVVNSYSDRTEDHAIAADLAARHGVEAVYIKADMARPDECRGLVEQAVSRFGTLDILVNNAGIQLRKPLVELEAEEWRRVIDTNLSSAFFVGREAARRMIPRGCGKIVNIGSLMSAFARPTVAPYTAAKGGIKLLTQSMAAEWAAYGIQANAIGPGYMLTDMNEALTSNPQFDAWVKGRTPSRRWGRPEELVGAAVFLASSASDYVNGQIIYVDGGMSAVL